MTFSIQSSADADTAIFRVYQVEFHHINRASKDGRKRLGKITGLQGMTTCVVIRGATVAIATAICSESDQFSRERGREEALRMAMRRCRPFRVDIQPVLEAYKNRKLDRAVNALRGLVAEAPTGFGCSWTPTTAEGPL